MTTTQRKRILSVTIHRDVDTDPDLSFLGTYSNHPEGDATIDREERDDCGRGEYRYFNPAMTGEETGNPKSPEQDYQRMQAYNRGDWCMIGVYATAQVVISGDVVQTILSGGLWGIESDSGEDYFAEEEANQLHDLREQLTALGFKAKSLSKAFADVAKRTEA